MSDLVKEGVKEGVKGFFNSKTISQVIALIIVIVTACTFMFSQIIETNKNDVVFAEWKKTNQNIENLLYQMSEKQTSALEITADVKKAHIAAENILKHDFNQVLGKTLNQAGIQGFPTDLNAAYARFGNAFGEIKNKLIPGDKE
jgi:hypothetical protein